jgi:hypothetical protein
MLGAQESAMDDATPPSTQDVGLNAAIARMDANDGFAVLQYQGREVILMSGERFEAWEDAVDSAAIERSLVNPDLNPISLEDLRQQYSIPASGK